MKKLIMSVLVTGIVGSLAGCATSHPVGNLFTNVSLPVNATDESSGAKMGEATCSSYLSMVALGDCSIEAAKQNAGINKVSSVDWHAHNILGLIGHYKVVVRGN